MKINCTDRIIGCSGILEVLDGFLPGVGINRGGQGVAGGLPCAPDCHGIDETSPLKALAIGSDELLVLVSPNESIS